MTSHGQDTDVTCLAAGCPNPVEQKPSGRRRRYCSDRCGAKHRRHRPRPQDGTDTDTDAYARAGAESLVERAETIMSLVAQGLTVDALREIKETIDDCELLRGAVVQQAHDRKTTLSELGAALYLSPHTLGRWKDTTARRRARNGGAFPSPADTGRPWAGEETAAPSVPGQRRPETAAPRTRHGQGNSAADAFPQAMLHLHHNSRLTFTALGRAADVDRSYISRIVSGERFPSWEVTCRITLACGVTPEKLRTLWTEARCRPVPEDPRPSPVPPTPDPLPNCSDRALTKEKAIRLRDRTRFTGWASPTILSPRPPEAEPLTPLGLRQTAHAHTVLPGFTHGASPLFGSGPSRSADESTSTRVAAVCRPASLPGHAARLRGVPRPLQSPVLLLCTCPSGRRCRSGRGPEGVRSRGRPLAGRRRPADTGR